MRPYVSLSERPLPWEGGVGFLAVCGPTQIAELAAGQYLSQVSQNVRQRPQFDDDNRPRRTNSEAEVSEFPEMLN